MQMHPWLGVEVSIFPSTKYRFSMFPISNMPGQLISLFKITSSSLGLLDAGRPKWELKVQKYQILKLDNNTTTLRDPMKELQKWELDFYESARIQWEWIILTINIYSFIPTWSMVTSDITGRIGHFVCSISWMWTNAQLRWTLCNLCIRRIPAWGGQQILFVSITQKFLYSSKVQFLIFLVNFVQNKVIESYYSEMEHLIQLSSFSLQPFSELNHISFDEIFCKTIPNNLTLSMGFLNDQFSLWVWELMTERWVFARFWQEEH